MSPPLVIGHRGASGDAPENTLKSFELAYKQGADGIELDIFLTRDKELVVTHDECLERLTGHKIKTRQSTLRELKKLNFGDGEKIPTLEEVFDHFASKFQVINVEIKSTGLLSDGVEVALASVVKKFGLSSKILVSSFNLLHLRRMKKLNPHMLRGYLSCTDNWYIPPALGVKLADAGSVNLDFRLADPEILQYYLEQKKQIWLWTVNSQQDMKFWVGQSVSALITNFPGRLKKLLEENHETKF